MPPDTTPAAADVTIDGGFAEPAGILARLAPDDLYPARLAGPHAWHPWGLTTTPATDRHLTLVLPPASTPATADRLLDQLAIQLARTPWPPCAPLDAVRHGHQLHCQDDAGRRSLVELASAAGLEPAAADRQIDVVNRDGWPILDELTALNDRLRHVNADAPTRTDVADLTRWVETKMSTSTEPGRITTPLAELLHRYIARPGAAQRLSRILDRAGHTSEMHHRPILGYLSETIDQTRSRHRSTRQ